MVQLAGFGCTSVETAEQVMLGMLPRSLTPSGSSSSTRATYPPAVLCDCSEIICRAWKNDYLPHGCLWATRLSLAVKSSQSSESDPGTSHYFSFKVNQVTMFTNLKDTCIFCKAEFQGQRCVTVPRKPSDRLECYALNHMSCTCLLFVNE